MKYVVIGASAAGISAVKNLRDLDETAEIIVISKDEVVHSRCMLHKIIDDERTVESIDFAGKDFFADNNVKWIKGTAVTAVNPNQKTITLENGETISFDKLLITSGANSFVPPVENLRECADVYCLRNIEDATSIKERVKDAKHVVVMGAGLVGLDAVYALAQKGLQIDVVEMADRILPLQLDATAAKMYQDLFEANGVKFHLSTKLVKVNMEDNKRIQSVEFDNGTVIECDFMVVASGVRANTQFLEGSGIDVKNGIVVDDYMRTSQKDIFAAGDVTGLSGTWGGAVKQGLTAARNMINEDTSMYIDRYQYRNTMNFFGLPALSVGIALPYDESCDMMLKDVNGIYQKIIIKDGIVQGFVSVGDISNLGHWQYIIKNKLSIADIQKHALDISFADFFEIDPENGQYMYAM